jgi:hypothetical protein
MNLGSTPTVSYLDPEAGVDADLLDALRTGLGRGPILVAADAASRASGWAPRALLALADGLSTDASPVTVIDLELEDPGLHGVAGVRNDEGVTDALLFGASIEHLALPVPGRRLRLVPAGPFIPDPAEVLASSGWTHVVEEATATGGGLLLYMPAETAGGRFMDRVAGVVALQGDGASDGFAGFPARLLARLSPVPTTTVAPPAERPDEAAADRDALIADLRARQQAALAATERTASTEPHRAIVPGGRAGEGEREPRRELTEPPASAKPPPAVAPTTRVRPQVLVPTLVVVLLLAALYGFWHYLGRDYVALRQEAQRQADGVTPAQPTAPEPAGEPLRYSVAIEAHPDLPTAVTRVESLTAAEPGMGFYIAPLLVDSVLYYRVLAGPVRDSASAAVLMDSLVARGHKTGSSEWDIRSTPYTFLLDEFATRDSAAARMNELRGLDIPAYVVEIPYTSGPPRYRLYSGAYSGPAEADVMRQLLRNTGLADTLVLRTGRTSS